MKTNYFTTPAAFIGLSFLLMTACVNQPPKPASTELAALNLRKGDLALCGKQEFGTINFGLTCMQSVREDFDLAIALLHSFEYEEAEKVFARVIDADPQCAIAYWGVAMSNYHPLWAPPSKEELEKSAKSLKIAQSLTTKTEREAQYINAIAEYYNNYEQVDHKTRAKLYADAMEKVYTQSPDDKEAAIFYALALNSVIDPTDKTFANQKKAGEILDTIFKDEPNHPGVAHYLIHTYDYPELAHLALSSARRYVEIAPSSAHAQHMPSHIFIRLGLWEESIASNAESAESAKCYSENLGNDGHWHNELHALDYLMYAYLQSSQLEKADEVLRYMEQVDKVYPTIVSAAYAMAAAPARHTLELQNWEAAAHLKQPGGNLVWDDFPWESAIINFTRALGAAHLKDMATAKTELEQLKAKHEKLVQKKDDYKSNQVMIQIKAAEAWISFAEGNKEKALSTMAEAADKEDATSKHPVTPGEVLPARELLGDLYMQYKMYDKALEAYELSLQKHQNRFNSLYGAALAAEKKGDKATAEKYYAQLVSITPNATGTRPALEHARQAVQSGNKET